nr:MAG TPA: hypothetical protein [Caudoviricetes sp.]
MFGQDYLHTMLNYTFDIVVTNGILHLLFSPFRLLFPKTRPNSLHV